MKTILMKNILMKKNEKLLNVNLLINKIEALKLTPFIIFVLENPSSSPIPVMDSDFLVEEVDTFLVFERLDTSGVLPSTLSPIHPVINSFDELIIDECFDPGRGNQYVIPDVKGNATLASDINDIVLKDRWPAKPTDGIDAWEQSKH
ncbi:hypothetical protein Tco_0819330 [Tanacetum coccineum]|uniref:Reverse transcriptase domain-containing protein n=1 Tax=Tanacetum coccineum TaxID=301880 RepID=A0ABQ5A688_9ASTR